MTTRMDFADWLQQELTNRGWNQAELVRRSGLSVAHISRLASGMRPPGPDAVNGIARALHLPAEDVMRKAGLLPMPVNATVDDRRSLAELVRKLERLGPEDRRYAAELLDRIFPNAPG